MWSNQKSVSKANNALLGKFAAGVAAKRNVASSSSKGAGETEGNGEVPLSPAEAQALQGALQDATDADAEADAARDRDGHSHKQHVCRPTSSLEFQ